MKSMVPIASRRSAACSRLPSGTSARRRLMLARDRIGIKPLYYGTAAGRFMFASELKAMLQLPEVDRRLNWERARASAGLWDDSAG